MRDRTITINCMSNTCRVTGGVFGWAIATAWMLPRPYAKCTISRQLRRGAAPAGRCDALELPQSLLSKLAEPNLVSSTACSAI